MEERVSEDTDRKRERLPKAKTVSLIGKIVGGSVILSGHILKWLNILPNATSGEICACGFSLMGVFGTIDLNIMVDKITGRRNCA